MSLKPARSDIEKVKASRKRSFKALTSMAATAAGVPRIQSLADDHLNRACSPLTVVEFLLQPEKLDNEIESDSAAIAHILAFMEKALQELLPAEKEENDSDLIQKVVFPKEQSKKVRVLKLLSLKLAGFTHWNFKLLAEKLPLLMQYALFGALLMEMNVSVDVQEQMSMEELSDQSWFSLYLIHRWCIYSLVSNSLARKPKKQLPPTPATTFQADGTLSAGLMTSTNAQPITPDMVLAILQNQAFSSVSILNKLLNCRNGNDIILVPSEKSIINVGSLSMTEADVCAWHEGERLRCSIFLSNICFDLARFWFMDDHFSLAKVLFEQSAAFSDLEADELSGYLASCNVILEEENANEILPPKYASLSDELQVAIKEKNYKHLLEVLWRDNVKKVIPLTLRITLEEEVPDKVLAEVRCANVIRCVVSASFVRSTTKEWLVKNFGSDAGAAKILMDGFANVLQSSSFAERDLVKGFLRWWCRQGNNVEYEVIAKNLNAEDYQSKLQTEQEKLTFAPVVKSLERNLLSVYSAAEIKPCIFNIMKNDGQIQVSSLSEEWALPDTYNAFINPFPSDVQRETMRVLLGKAKQCFRLGNLDAARALFGTVMYDCPPGCPLKRLVQWDLLTIDVTQCDVVSAGVSSRSLLDKRVVQSVTALVSGQDVMPADENSLCCCVAYLLNSKQWGYLSGMGFVKIAHLKFGKLLSSVRWVGVENGSVSTCKTLLFWELVESMFRVEPDRTGGTGGILTSGMMKNIVVQLKEPGALGLCISILCRMLSLIDDTTITAEYLNFWPDAFICNTDYMKSRREELEQLLRRVLRHALSVCPSQTSWLQTCAHLLYEDGDYAGTMGHLLEAGSASSDWFVNPVPEDVFTQQVIAMMIKCCSQLRHYTACALLCQLTEPPDCQTAIKALEGQTSSGPADAMDACYPFFWNINILEILCYVHGKRGELQKQELVVNCIRHPDLNVNNSYEAQQAAKRLRMQQMLRFLLATYANTTLK